MVGTHPGSGVGSGLENQLSTLHLLRICHLFQLFRPWLEELLPRESWVHLVPLGDLCCLQVFLVGVSSKFLVEMSLLLDRLGVHKVGKAGMLLLHRVDSSATGLHCTRRVGRVDMVRTCVLVF